MRGSVLAASAALRAAHLARLLALVLAAPLALAEAPAAVAPIQPAPLRIMLIGDSITEGDAGGYRYPLFQQITQASAMPNFVGRRNGRLSDPPEFVDDDHEGYSAYRIDQITSGEGFWGAPPIETRLKDWDPAVVTIHAGTNDAQQHYLFHGDPVAGIPSAIGRLDDLVSRIIAFNPAIYIIVAQIIPANPPASERTSNYVVKLNAQIPELVARHQADGHRVSMVDMYTPMLAHPNPDGIHPSAEGAQVMAGVYFQGLQALGVLPKNPDPGRLNGVHQVDHWSPTSTGPWTLSPNLLRAGSATLESASTTGYKGKRPATLLNDGLLDNYTNERDNQFSTRFTLRTATTPQGFDVREIRSVAGLPIAANGDEQAHQAYEIWWSSVDAPDSFVRLGDFHHIMVNRTERSSRIVINRADDEPLARRVKAIEFRFVEPPLRQVGFIGIGNPTRYRELEAFGAPSP